LVRGSSNNNLQSDFSLVHSMHSHFFSCDYKLWNSLSVAEKWKFENNQSEGTDFSHCSVWQ
jgi:hypothetical protein